MTSVTCYQWGKKRNWGDLLSVPLLNYYAGVDAVGVPHPRASVVVAVGSTLGHMHPGWAGTVLGAGILRPTDTVPWNAGYLAVRGPITAGRLGARGDRIVQGDPGLIADELVPVPRKRYDRVVLGHWSDDELCRRREFQSGEMRALRADEDPLQIIEAIGAAECVVTSSLHGLILADAFGRPRRFEMPPSAHANEGGMLKFHDYHQSIGMDFEIGVKRAANRFTVNDVRDRLKDAFELYGKAFRKATE